MFIAGWLVWLGIFILAPVKTDVNQYISMAAFPVLLEYNAYFLVGILIALFLVKMPKSNKSNNVLSTKYLYLPFLVILTFALLIDILQIIESFLVFKNSADLIELRRLYRDASRLIYPHWLEITIFLFFKVSIFPIFLILLSDKEFKNKHRFVYYLAILIAIYPLFNFLFFGKRAFTFVALTIYMWYVIYFSLWKKKVFFITFIILLIGIFLTSAIVFQKREQARNFSLHKSVNLKYSYPKTVLPTDEFNQFMDKKLKDGDHLTAQFNLYMMNFAQYYTHGVFEFFHLYEFNQKKTPPRANGKLTFSMPYKALHLLGLIKLEGYSVGEGHIINPRLLDSRPLYFDSFFGSQLKDWGDYAKYLMLLFGIIFGLGYIFAQSNHFLFPLYAVLSGIVFSFPITNLLYTGQAWHYITLSILFFFFMQTYTWFKAKKTSNNRFFSRI